MGGLKRAYSGLRIFRVFEACRGSFDTGFKGFRKCSYRALTKAGLKCRIWWFVGFQGLGFVNIELSGYEASKFQG